MSEDSNKNPFADFEHQTPIIELAKQMTFKNSKEVFILQNTYSARPKTVKVTAAELVPLENEYLLIQKKESKLSANQRRKVAARYEYLQRLFQAEIDRRIAQTMMQGEAEPVLTPEPDKKGIRYSDNP